MAIAVLPYPSMDFTPLDVLTADELDQLVANINAVNNGTVPTANIADGGITTAKLANNAVATGKIDWTTIVGTVVDGDPVSSGYADFGTIRVQWKNNRYSSLSTSAGAYTTFSDQFPASFKNANYSVIVSETSDTGNVAGGNFKVVSKTSSGVTLNYNHTGAIGDSILNYSIFAIGLKP